MNPIAEKILLKEAIAKLELEVKDRSSELTIAETIGYMARIHNLKACYTHVLELLAEERREVHDSAKTKGIDSTRYSMWDTLLRKGS